MNRPILFFLTLAALVFFGLFQTAYAQSCQNIMGGGGSLSPNRKCAPVNASYDVWFYSNTQLTISQLQIKIDWNDGNTEAFSGAAIVETAGTPSDPNGFTYTVSSAHSYPQGGATCEYNPTGVLFIDGQKCNEEVTRNLVVWDTDDANGGEIALAPARFLACPGQEFTVTFKDVSDWNCTPPEVTDKMNKFSRWTRFTYGTVETETSTPRIGGIAVGGSVRTYPYRDAVKEYIYTEGGPDVIAPGEPNNTSLAVKVPANAQVGEIFEIKLENWNRCNPYDPADESNAVFNYAYIEIVAPPVVEIVSDDNICPNTSVTFSANETTSLDDNSLFYQWEVFDDETGTSSLGTGIGTSFTFDGFSSSGKKLVRLKAERTDLGMDFLCEAIVEKVITVQEAPVIKSFINGEEKKTLDLCFDANNPSRQVDYKFNLYRYSTNEYEYRLTTFAANSTSETPDGDLIYDWTTVGAGEADPQEVLYSPVYTQPGRYRLQMEVRDKLTACTATSESIVTIYGQPTAAFTAAALCEGTATEFTDASSLATTVAGDQISSWAWDIDNNGQVDYTTQNVSHTYAAAGDYQVALEVLTKGGCSHRIVKEVKVNPVPKALLGYDYTEAICPGEPVTFENLSIAQNTGTLFPDGVVYSLLVSDGTNTEEKEFTGDTRTLTFNNTSSAELVYSIQLKAKANTSGCERLSDPLEVRVKPGAKADFYEPNYSIFNTNCSPVELNLFVDQPTLDLAGDSHTWRIEAEGMVTREETFIPGQAGYEQYTYQAENNTNAGLTYTITLLVQKAGTCIQQAVHKYRVNPVPAAEDFPLETAGDCAFTEIKVKVAEMAGVKDLHWSISPQPYNHGSISYDDEFTLIYERPAKNVPAYQVELSLIKENFFGCQSEEVKKQVDILPQVIEKVELQLASSETAGCSPLEAAFENNTVAPAGTVYELFIKYGTEAEQKAELTSEELAGTFSYSFEVSGSYIIRLKAIAPDGCAMFSDSPVNLMVYDGPQPNFTLDKTEGCAPFTASFIKSIQNSTDNQWTITDLLTGEVDGPFTKLDTYTFTNSGDALKTYEVLLQSRSANGCTADSSLQVQVYPAEAASFTLVQPELCAPYEAVVQNTSVNPAGTTYSWDWDDGSTTSSKQAELSHSYVNTSYSNAIYKTITLTVTTPDGCVSSSQQQLILQPQLKAAVYPSATEGCAPLQLYFQNNSEGANSHFWEVKDLSGGTVIYEETSSLPTIPELANSGSTTKNYQIRYVASNSSTGCSEEQLIAVSVKPGTEALFGLDQSTVCADTEVLFINQNIQPGIQYIWRWNDGEPNDTTTTETSIAHTFVNTSTTRAKQFEVELMAWNPNSDCSDSYKQTVWVSPTMELLVSPDKSAGCGPLEVSFSNQSGNVAMHRWYVREQGSAEEEQQQTVAEAIFRLDNQSGGVKNYEVVYVGVSPEGCADSTVHTIEVYPQPKPAFTTDSLRVRLPNSTFQLSNETPHAASWNHHWDFGDGTTSDAVHPGSHTYATYGSYTITLTVSNGQCTQSYSQEVKVNEILPLVDFESIPVSGCGPLTVQFKNKSKYANPETYFWDFGDGEGYSSGENPTYTYYKPGEYTVTLTASNPTGEVVSTSYAIVTVYGRPKIDFALRESVVFVPGDPVYVANYTKGAASYIWNFGDGTEYTEFEPVHYYQEPGIYTISLVALNEWGCADTLVREEVVTAMAGGKVKIPNAFTPSSRGPVGGDIGAGNNDVFYPVLEGGIVRYNLKIYNRWGELLFESNNRQMGWDGYYKGRLSKADVYVYKLSVEFSDGKTMDKLGDVTLVR